MLYKNHLESETSPYLQQHANNPVHWYPWNDTSLKLSQDTGKPILLSIGYSACHWCHVMAHESFEDEETAQIMNQYFINIKVDREERPDLDKIYQTALQILTQKSGGWPLTMFLTPQQVPFFGGTYFPKRAGFGLPSFKQLLKNVADYFYQHQNEINEITTAVQKTLQEISTTTYDLDLVLSEKPITTAHQDLLNDVDPMNGGFGKAPKFPHTPSLDRLLRDWASDRVVKKIDDETLAVIYLTLNKMAEGGIYDQLGGGFFRYSVDAQWIIPHFEKMLYDNALLLMLYTDAYVASQKPLYKKVAVETAEWVMREMQGEDGGYYSTINADSEGHEGKFYYWTREEIKSLLSADEFKVVERYYGIHQPANFEDQFWHLHIAEPIEMVAVSVHQTLEDTQGLLAKARSKLLQARSKKTKPERDEKILTAWNALMIKAMLKAGIALNRPDFIDSAKHALQFIEAHLFKDQRPLATYKDGQARYLGYLDDVAFLLDAILFLLQIEWSTHYFNLSLALAKNLHTYFLDEQHGGFYFTAKDQELLIQRPKPFMDEATPSGNGIASYCLLNLGYLTANDLLLNQAVNTLKAAWKSINYMPVIYSTLLTTLDEYLNPPTIIIVRSKDPSELQKWKNTFFEYYLPRHLFFAISAEQPDLPPELDKPVIKDKTIAYVCQGKTCHLTIDTFAEFKKYLQMQL